MTDEAPQENGPAAAKRGEAAWKQERERVADRNAQARKVGKQRREAYEAQRAQARADNERREMAELLRKQDARR